MLTRSNFDFDDTDLFPSIEPRHKDCCSKTQDAIWGIEATYFDSEDTDRFSNAHLSHNKGRVKTDALHTVSSSTLWFDSLANHTTDFVTLRV